MTHNTAIKLNKGDIVYRIYRGKKYYGIFETLTITKIFGYRLWIRWDYNFKTKTANIGMSAFSPRNIHI